MKRLLTCLIVLAVAFCFMPFEGGAGFTADAASTIAAPTDVQIVWNESWDEPSCLKVYSKNTNQFENLANFYESYVQVDWRFTGDEISDTWKYSSSWDSNVKAVKDSLWEVHYWAPDYDGTDFVWLFNFDSEYKDDSRWYDSENPVRGWSSKVPEDIIIPIKWKNETLNTIDWSNVGLKVRVRYVAEFYDDSIEDEGGRLSYICSDWTEAEYGYFAKDYKTIDNLLINPDFEEGLKGWTNPDGTWSVIANESGYLPQHGRFLAWGYRSASLESDDTCIYQDVDLSAYQADETVVFNTLICNYDQPPHDMGKIKLVFYDKDNKALETYTQSQRNPSWNSQSIVASIPEKAVKARAYLMAHRYVGSDIDAYYDYCSLVVKPEKVYPVIVTEKSNKEKAKKGDTLTLTADNSRTKDPSAYTWSSSYNTAATVDKNGKVTMHTDGEDGVAIYAKDNETGVTGVYWINSDETNASADFDVKEFCKGLSLKFNGKKTDTGKTAFYFGPEGTANLKKIEANGYTLEFVYYKAESKSRTTSPKCTIYMSKSSKKSSKNGYQMIPTKGTHNYYYYYVCQINVKDQFNNNVATISKDQVKFGWARWTGKTVK